jgi:hypothetical protein
MGHRIRQLEDAIAIFQSGVSSETHPLLREELLTIKFPPERGAPSDALDDTSDTIDALGTLTIGDQGGKYYGPSAGTEVRASSTNDNDFSNEYLLRRFLWYVFILVRTHTGNHLQSGWA